MSKNVKKFLKKQQRLIRKKEILLGSVSDDEAKTVWYYLMGQAGCYSRATKHIFKLFIMVYMWS